MLSLDILIKRETLKIHEKFLANPKSLSSHQRKIMSAGLFSIFDLSDQFFASRQSLFSQAQWKFINDYFDEKLKLPMYTLETVTKDTIATVENTLNLSGNYDAVIDYIRKIRDKNKNKKILFGQFSIIKYIMHLMNHYNHYLVKYTQLNLCENDYLRTVWSSILEFLFPPKEKVRIIIGESENKHTTKEKAYLYRNSSNIHGFKINIRLVVDIGGDEADLVVSECAKNDEDNKIIQDEEKLLRKSKDALDGMIQNVSGSDCCLAAYFTQFNGTSCALSTTHLAANGLYVST